MRESQRAHVQLGDPSAEHCEMGTEECSSPVKGLPFAFTFSAFQTLHIIIGCESKYFSLIAKLFVLGFAQCK